MLKFKSLYDSKLKPLFDICYSGITNITAEIFSRENKLTVPLFIYALCHTNGLNKTFDDVVSDFKLDRILNITKGAIMNKRKIIRSKHFRKINKKLIDQIFTYNKYKIKIVDGSIFYLPKSFTEYGFQLSNNGKCCKVLLSVILDAETKIPISYHIHKTFNERKAFIRQLSYLEEGDLVIFDGGYFSNELISTLNEHNIDYIFRISENKNIVKQLNENKRNDMIVEHYLNKKKIIQLRVIKYTYKDIDKEHNELIKEKKYKKEKKKDVVRNGHKSNTYYLTTSLINRYTLPEFMNLYNERWEIEIYFNYLKYYLSLGKIRSKSYESLKQDLYINQFISIISLYIKYLLKKENEYQYKANQHINTHTCIYIVVSKLMELILLKYKHNSRYVKSNVCNIRTGVRAPRLTFVRVEYACILNSLLTQTRA